MGHVSHITECENDSEDTLRITPSFLGHWDKYSGVAHHLTNNGLKYHIFWVDHEWAKWVPRTHDKFTQCWCNVGSSSATLAQHCINIGCMSVVERANTAIRQIEGHNVDNDVLSMLPLRLAYASLISREGNLADCLQENSQLIHPQFSIYFYKQVCNIRTKQAICLVFTSLQHLKKDLMRSHEIDWLWYHAGFLSLLKLKWVLWICGLVGILRISGFPLYLEIRENLESEFQRKVRELDKNATNQGNVGEFEKSGKSGKSQRICKKCLKSGESQRIWEKCSHQGEKELKL